MTLVLNKKERYTQGEIDLLFNTIVPKIMYGFSVYEPSISALLLCKVFNKISQDQALYIC